MYLTKHKASETSDQGDFQVLVPSKWGCLRKGLKDVLREIMGMVIFGGGNGTYQIVNLAFGGQNLLPEGLIPW